MKSTKNRFEDQLFIEAIEFWNLEKLYLDLAQQKLTRTGKQVPLTPVEKAILRGLLCGYPTQNIAAALHWAPGTLCVELSKGLYRYVEILTNRESNTLKNWRDISTWLEAAGYKTPRHRYDWGDAPDIHVLYQRTSELDTLKQWISQHHCRLISIVGMVGVGKTTLAVKLAQEIQSEFDYVIWRSLRYAPPLNQMLANLIQFLSNQPSSHLPEDIKVLISHLIDCLRQHRCLVVLDDTQMLMRSCAYAGQYRERYKDYSELLTEVGRERHQSCLVLVSREKPLQMELLEHETSYICSLKLQGLPSEASQKLLLANGLSGKVEEWEELITLYRGNPLALNTVATTIKDFFNSSISEFLTWNTVIVADPLQSKLIEHLNRLENSEKQIIGYLVRNSPTVGREQLRNELQLGCDSNLINALKSLERRSLLEKTTEKNQTFFTLPPIVIDVIRTHDNIEFTYSTSRLLSTTSRYLMANHLNVS